MKSLRGYGEVKVYLLRYDTIYFIVRMGKFVLDLYAAHNMPPQWDNNTNNTMNCT